MNYDSSKNKRYYKIMNKDIIKHNNINYSPGETNDQINRCEQFIFGYNANEDNIPDFISM